MPAYPRTRERLFLRLLAIYGLVVLALHLLADQLPISWGSFWHSPRLIGPGGRLLPAEWLWGVYPYTYLPVWLRWSAALLAGIVLIWAGWGRDSGRGFALRWRHRFQFDAPHAWGQLILAGLSFGLFFTGRVVHTRWGDAYLLVNGIAHPKVRLTYNWQAPLDTYVHARLFQLGERLWGWQDALPAYWWLSSLAGAAAVWVMLRLAAAWGRTTSERWFIFGSLATLGSVQLFFGYPENYTFISLLILLYLWLAWRCWQGQATLWAPSLALALAHGFHPSTLVLQPSLWLLAWMLHRRQAIALSRLLFPLLSPPALVGAGVLALMTSGGHGLAALLGAEAPGGGDQRWLVPLRTLSSTWEYYTLFSRGHLIEIINQQLLVMPFALPLLLWLGLCFGLWGRGSGFQIAGFQVPGAGFRAGLRFAWFLLAAAVCYLLLTWVWNPDYGGQRDWDLFAPAAWPVMALAAYGLTRTLSAAALSRAALIILTLQGLHTAAWVFSNTRPWDWP